MKSNKCVWCDKDFDSVRVANFCSSNCRAKERYSRDKDKIAEYKKKYFQEYKRSEAYRSSLVGDNRNTHDKECLNCSKSFKAVRKTTKHCSRKCSSATWRKNNKQRIHEDQKNRYKNDTCRRISTNIRSRLNKALKGAYKVDSIIGSLGCTPEDLKTHLETQFQEGMTWDNYGLHGWHIDHIKPLDAFDLTDREQFKEACHYTNLQPMWATENISKGATHVI